MHGMYQVSKYAYLCTVQWEQETSVAQMMAPLEHLVTSERKEIFNIS